jgi:hypothetical protein
MEKSSTIKKAGRATHNAVAPLLDDPAARIEMPETPGLKLPEGKISTATRKQLFPFIARRPNGARKK